MAETDSTTALVADETIENETYDSASDEDFNPETAAQEDAESSESEDDAPAAANASTKTKRKRDDTQIDAELDSGDEVTINARKRSKKKHGKNAGKGEDEEVVVFSDDEGGEGGLIKTRAQRRVEKVERKVKVPKGATTIDVDSFWEKLKNAPVGREITPEPAGDGAEPKGKENEADYITIKRTYRFAGEVHTEERRVLKSSKEAKLWLEEQEGKNGKGNDGKENEAVAGDVDPAKDAANDSLPMRRPLRRPSRFDPNPTGYVKALGPEHQLTWQRKTGATAVKAADGTMKPPPRVRFADIAKKPEKITTVGVSKVEWAKFVDKQGIAEELDAYGKSKQGYMGREDFLQRVQAQQEGDRREARLAGNAAAAKGAAAGGV